MNTLWILRPTPRGADDPWDPWYDKCFGFIICAPSEEVARRIAHENAGDENRGEFMQQKIANTTTPWLDPNYSSCFPLTAAHEEGVIMRDFASA